MRLFIATVLLLILAAPLRADDLTARIQRQYESLRSFEADFKQTLKNAASKETETRSGRIWFRQPDLLRWETAEPEPELLIVGKEAVWDYFPEEEAAYKYDLAQMLDSETVIRFLSGKADLQEDFWVERGDCEDGMALLLLAPKQPEPSLTEARVWVNPDTALISKVLVVDFYGNENLVDLENLVLNPDISDGLFEFEPPEEVDVFDNTAG